MSLTWPDLRVAAHSFEDLSVSDFSTHVGYTSPNGRNWGDGGVAGDQIQSICLILQRTLNIRTVQSMRLE